MRALSRNMKAGNGRPVAYESMIQAYSPTFARVIINACPHNAAAADTDTALAKFA